jgi:hypothetical protein
MLVPTVTIVSQASLDVEADSMLRREIRGNPNSHKDFVACSDWGRPYTRAPFRHDLRAAREGAATVLQDNGPEPGLDDLAELEAELARLKEEHRDLDTAIEALERMVAGDQLQIQRLKKRKLALKDRIRVLSDQLTPDIIA